LGYDCQRDIERGIRDRPTEVHELCSGGTAALDRILDRFSPAAPERRCEALSKYIGIDSEDLHGHVAARILLLCRMLALEFARKSNQETDSEGVFFERPEAWWQTSSDLIEAIKVHSDKPFPEDIRDLESNRWAVLLHIVDEMQNYDRPVITGTLAQREAAYPRIDEYEVSLTQGVAVFLHPPEWEIRIVDSVIPFLEELGLSFEENR
jgi:hypothetical protein